MPNSGIRIEDQLFLGRQPILDRQQRLVAYELLFRTGQKNEADVLDGVRATATVIANAFSELAVGDALGSCRGFINVDESFLFSDTLELLPRQSVVLEILETVPPTQEVVARCRELKRKGFTLALDDVVQVAPAYRDLLALVDIIKVDIQLIPEKALAELTSKLVRLGKQLLAEKVDSREQMTRCMDMGYALFQGYYFARPTVIAGRRMQHSELALMRLLGLLLSDAENAALEAALKEEPGLTVNLLRITNSVGLGTVNRINSLGHAITVLGRRQLQRWLQLLLFSATGHSSGAANPLLQLAATRGHLLELLAAQFRPNDRAFADQAFMVGIMSLMPALINQTIRDIITPLGLTGSIRDALCEGSGELGQLLSIAECLEQDEYSRLGEILIQFPGIHPGVVSQCLTKALAWARRIGGTLDG